MTVTGGFVPDVVPGDEVDWMAVCQILGSARTMPLLADLGVPSVMVAAPWPLQRVFEALGQAALDGFPPISPPIPTPASIPPLPHSPAGYDPYHQAWEAHVRATFAALAQAYGEAAARELHRWIQRHILDEADQRWWDTWFQLLFALADREKRGGRPATLPPLGSETLARVVALAAEQLGRQALARDTARIAAAVRRPRSTFDQRALRGRGLPKGEVLSDIDSWLQLIHWRQRAYTVWQQLRQLLTPEEQAALLAWGQAEALRVAGRTLRAAPPDV